MQTRYFRPKSLGWWAGVGMIATGLVMATLPIHGWVAIIESVRNVAPTADPVTLIGTGAGIIGIRDAIARGGSAS